MNSQIIIIITIDYSFKFIPELNKYFFYFKEKMNQCGPDSLWYYFDRIIGQKAMCKVPACKKKILDLGTTIQTELSGLSTHLSRKHSDLNNQRKIAKNNVEEQKKEAKEDKLSYNREIQIIQGL